MSRDGPGGSNTNGLATWLRCKDFSNTETNYDAYMQIGFQKLRAAMKAKPDLRAKARELMVALSIEDPWTILSYFGLANEQFTFRDGVGPPHSKQATPKLGH
jgi:hypothetical protein